MLGRVAWWIDGLLFAGSAVLLGLLFRAWWIRLGYPFDIEWMEGGMLAHAWRVTHGLPLYAPPSAEWVPFLYPPGYSWLLALAGRIAGLDYATGRAISIAGTLAGAAAAAFCVHRLARDRTAAIAAAVLFLGTWSATGEFFDLVRPDGLLIGCLGWSVACALVPGRAAATASGLLLTGAFLVKHNAAALGPAIALGIGLRDGWRAVVPFALASAGLSGIATAALQLTTDGLFLTYLLEVPASHPRLFARVLPGLPREVGAALPFAIALLAGVVLLDARRLPGVAPLVAIGAPVLAGFLFGGWLGGLPLGDSQSGLPAPAASVGMTLLPVLVGRVLLEVVQRARRRAPSFGAARWFALALAICCLVIVGAMRAHNGGYINVYIPLFWLLAVGTGLAAASWRAAPSPLPRFAASALLLAQIGWQIYRFDVGSVTPTALDVQTGESLVAHLRDAPDPLLSPFAAWLPIQAGKSAPSLHLEALWDLESSRGPLFAEAKAIRAEINGGRFAAVLDSSLPLTAGFGPGYVADDTLQLPDGVFHPRTGYRARPERLWVLDSAPSEARPRGTGRR
jgi:hypothetical protein